MDIQTKKQIREYCEKVNCVVTDFNRKLKAVMKENEEIAESEAIEIVKKHFFDRDVSRILKTLDQHFLVEDLDFNKFYKELVLNRFKTPSRHSMVLIQMTAVNFPEIKAKIEEYKIDGKTLFEISMEEGFAYESIKRRIKELREELPNKDMDFIIRLATAVLRDGDNFGYRYKNYHLHKVCKTDSLNYLDMLNNIEKLKEEFPEKNIEEIIKTVLEIEYETLIFHYVKKNVINSKCCKVENIDYPNLLKDALLYKEEKPASKISVAIDNSIMKNVILESTILDEETRNIEENNNSRYYRK